MLHVQSSRFCIYLLNIYHFTYTFLHAHTEAYTHKHTCKHTREITTKGTGALLRWVKERLLLETKALHTGEKKRKESVRKIYESKKKGFGHIELLAKLLDHFLRSNKRRESSKRNYYIISPGVIIKAIIIVKQHQ